MANPYKDQAQSSVNAKIKSMTGSEAQDRYDMALKRAGITGTATIPNPPEQSVAQFEIDRPANAPEYGSPAAEDGD